VPGLSRSWRATLAGMALLGLLALAAGWLLHAVVLALWLATVLVLAGMLWRVARVARWLERRRHVPLARGSGVLDEWQNLVRQRQLDARAGRRRLVTSLRAFRDAAAALPDAVVALDRERRIEWFNPAGTHLLGLAYPHAIGAPLTRVVQAPPLAEWLAGGGAEPLADLPSPLDAGLHLGVRLIPYSDGRALLVVRDVSRLMRLEHVRRDFVANVSHELRTPLTVVHGYLDMIEPEQIPEYESIVRELRSQSRRMTRIVEDLLTLSRLEASTDLAQERVNLAPLLEALRREALALGQNAHDVVVQIDDGRDLLGSAPDLHSAFSNLVSNAVRYTPAGGRITLRWHRAGDGASLSVVDTGQGIPPQHLPRLTERFYRVSTSRSRETGGTGLGLSIVKHVLQLHQARLEIASEAGVGSTFACVFDAARLLPPLACTAPP
jgi:two-component system, OmpR family, phosphate regulon sensor histidine kinase PhoR